MEKKGLISPGSKTKKIFFRTGILLIAITFGTLIFLLLTFAGQKSKGPLDDLLTSTNTDFSHFEKNIFTTRDSRAQNMAWFDRYRNSKTTLNTVDTILMGAYDDNTAESYQPIVALEDSLQINLPVISIYSAWGSKKNQVFPLLRAQAIYDLGSIPMITWEPWLDDFDPGEFPVVAGKKFKNLGGLKEIAEGKFDAYIDKWAGSAKKFGHPFLLRFGHEMNDPYRYPWGPPNNGPEDFIAAWRHIVSRFKSIGADSVIWIWSPHPAYTSYPQFYPGHEYVDWIGVTTLNYGTVASWSQWWSFDEIFGKFYDSVSLYKKPMMLTEFSSLAVGGDRAAWFKNALDSIPLKYPALKSIIFFHVTNDNTTTYKSLDWSFENDKPAAEAVKKSIHNWEKIKKAK
jgi:hypothetical protein